MVYTKPSTQDYDIYLHKIHGLKCDSTESSNCFHTINDLKSSHLTHQIIFMTAETKIFGDTDNKIRVVGIFNHFFVIENSLHPKSDNDNNIGVPLWVTIAQRPIGYLRSAVLA
ncbi:hypothetical protein GCM10010911_62630 [Paenibacillus nasutitermitis]|uniref:Uncharacterized protein n=1 Tax=Paenibacillus nasutitermitis TaxID=1652958 RepID=A0A916ZG41_9BACL|nr:hypothetical protein GCM10010911_62630 [Paenibacillus nasutitermitis]